MVRVVVVSLLLVLLCAQSGVGLQLGRRGAVRLAGSGAAAALVQPLAALATTAADKEPSPEFDASAAKRQAFLEKQKKYKKAWRKSLAELEYAVDDKERIAAITDMARSVKANGGAIPEGTRLMDLEQVYKKIKPEMETEARRDYLGLEGLVRNAVTAKDLRDFKLF